MKEITFTRHADKATRRFIIDLAEIQTQIENTFIDEDINPVITSIVVKNQLEVLREEYRPILNNLADDFIDGILFMLADDEVETLADTYTLLLEVYLQIEDTKYFACCPVLNMCNEAIANIERFTEILESEADNPCFVAVDSNDLEQNEESTEEI